MVFITYELRTSHTAYHVPSAPRLWTYPLVTRYMVLNLLVLCMWLCGWAPLHLYHPNSTPLLLSLCLLGLYTFHLAE